jgi:Arc/MetJ-type ribon-helix-helix transcriptional regulator
MAPKAQREKANHIIDSKIHTTTVRISNELHNEVKAVLDGGAFGSFNELLVAAVQNLLRARRERAVDQQFAQMAEDENYQKVALNLYNLFENSALEEHARTAGQSAAEVATAMWSEDLDPAGLLSTPRPSVKAGG